MNINTNLEVLDNLRVMKQEHELLLEKMFKQSKETK